MLKLPSSVILPKFIAENFCCMRFANLRMDESLRDSLTLNAADMLARNVSSVRFKIGCIKGRLTTAFRRATLGSITGIIVDGVIDHEEFGEGEIRFLINDQRLARFIKALKAMQ